MVYSEDIIIVLRKLDEHMEHVQQGLTLLNDVGVTLYLKNANSSPAASTTPALLFAQDALRS